MKRLLYIVTTLLTLTSCVDVDEYNDDPKGNLEALWQVMDQRYCFFKEKEELLGVNWNDVHSKYMSQVKGNMTKYELFDLMANMLAELRDGHVNLYSTFDTSRAWQWKEDYPQNYSDSLQRVYLGKSTEYRYASGIAYRKLCEDIGYMYVSTFNVAMSNNSIDEILASFKDCKGLIIDIRNNGGGLMTSAETLAQHFTMQKTLVGFIRHKTGEGHEDFSDYEEQYISPTTGVIWARPVRLLTNRSVFSAANEFTKYMKVLGAVQIGDTTGGGAGLPYSSDLPNGWTIRFSACPMYDTDKVCVEDGIAPEPSNKVDISSKDYQRDFDTIIEAAKTSLHTIQ